MGLPTTQQQITDNSKAVTKRGTIRLAHLTVSKEFQVRATLDKGTVHRYANAIRAGQQLPAVLVALVDGMHILLDGFHRVAARELLGETLIEAEVVETTRQDARWRAAKANMSHGLPLKTREIRTVFKVYVSTRQHLKAKQVLKSYREIAAELGCSHNTIRNWMAVDFPEVFKRYAGNEGYGDGGLADDRPKGQVRDGLLKLQEFTDYLRNITCADAKQQLIDALRAHAAELLGKAWEDEQADF